MYLRHLKLKRFDDDISSVCGSFNFEINNNQIKEVYIAYGGMAAIPKELKHARKFLKISLLISTHLTMQKII